MVPVRPGITALLRTWLRDRGLRRQWMTGLTALLVCVFFMGAVPLSGWLESRPFLFLAYWLGCLWLLVTVILLAVYDLLNLPGRSAARWRNKP
jgi:hypothetical protein